MAMVDILTPEFDYKYRFFGTQLVNIIGKELTGKSVNIGSNDDDALLDRGVIQNVMKSKAPSLMRSKVATARGKEYTKTTLYLPISQDGENIFSIVCINTFKLIGRYEPAMN